MRITIFAAGSQGDVQPCIMLGMGLQQAGFHVLLASPQNFDGLIQEYGLPFHPLRGDVQQIMAGETGRRFMETGGSNLIQSILAMRKMQSFLCPYIAHRNRKYTHTITLPKCRERNCMCELGKDIRLFQNK